MLRTNLTAQAIDDALAGSFPASDPPGWAPGIARLASENPRPSGVRDTALDRANRARAPAVIDVSSPRGSERTFVQALMSLAGAVGAALLFPLAVVAIGTPGRVRQ